MTDSDGAQQVAKSATERHVASQKNTTLTDAEREAVESAASAFEYDDDNLECGTIAATLRGLLERL
jgi:hypothetical protein